MKKTVRPRVTFCGPRGEAYKRFCHAKSRGEECLLLVDAEELADPKIAPWRQRRIVEGDQWEKPKNATDADLHFMAPTMEAWLVANPDVLADFFGKEFKAARMSRALDLERVSKGEIHDGLRAATRDSKKGEYGKGPHSFQVLARMEPAEVLKRCPHWAKRFCDELKKRGMK